MNRRRWTVVACGAVLVVFAALAGSAVSTKSPTLDEPMHALTGWLSLRQGDYHLEITNPPLWKLWAALGNGATSVPVDRSGPLWRPLAWRPVAEQAWTRRQLFETRGTDGGRIVGRARGMMLIVGVALGAAVAGWAGRLGGPVAAVVAVGLFAFDPTVLGHAPLVKSDVAEALAVIGLGWAAWRYGRRATVGGAVVLGGAVGAAVTVKFSGLLAGPILAAVLAIRAAGPTPWPAFGRVAATRRDRFAVAAVGCVAAAGLCYGMVWGCYRFRYAPTATGAVSIDTAAVFAAAGDGPVVSACRWADGHRLLPQAFVAGLVNQTANVRRWPAFLDGARYDDGRWTYYPLAAAYKTPSAELAAFAAAAAVGVAAALRRAWRRPGVVWAAACVGVPAVALAAAAVAAPLNVGLRNVVPVYALADVAAGAAAAWAWRRRPGVTAFAVVALLGGQAATAAAAWPDYIAFFNRIGGGPRGGLAHLSDGNLDWGQDVPALAAWQRGHPDVPLYVDLFASVDPAFYGLRFHRLWERDAAGAAELHLPPGPAVLAVSATHLQGLYVSPAQWPLLSRLAGRTPREVLHGTIYLYDYAPGMER